MLKWSYVRHPSARVQLRMWVLGGATILLVALIKLLERLDHRCFEMLRFYICAKKRIPSAKWVLTCGAKASTIPKSTHTELKIVERGPMWVVEGANLLQS